MGDLDRKANSFERQMLIGFIAAMIFLPSLILVPFFGIDGLYVGLGVTVLLFYFLGGWLYDYS